MMLRARHTAVNEQQQNKSPNILVHTREKMKNGGLLKKKKMKNGGLLKKKDLLKIP